MKKQSERGQVLVMVLLTLTVLAVMIPALVYWSQNESRWTVKEHKSTVAFNLASAGIERGMWKLKSSTATWNQALTVNGIAGYKFDVTYSDLAGGYYRIRFSTGIGANRVAVIAEGKDAQSKETRAIRAEFQNQTIPGAMISKGQVTWANAFSAHWGPVMAHKNINITDAAAAKEYFPRKFSRQVVKAPGMGKYARDTNELDPPNTDGVEWWSAYNVPDLPILDFEMMRTSAAANGTLNVYGCKATKASWDTNWKCPTSKPHTNHFGNPYHHSKAKQNLIWYWDGDVTFTGDTETNGCAMWGTIIVRGNLTLDVGDGYKYTANVPTEAWREYQKIDTKTANEYPGDAGGPAKCNATFKLGGETWTGGPTSGNTDVGVKGFIYVGKNLTIDRSLDLHGAVWVEGNINRSTGASERTVLFFDNTLSVPSLNVVLTQQSWEEIMPSNTAWIEP